MSSAEGSGEISPCPLCGARQSRWFAEVQSRRYLECGICHLVYLTPAARLSWREERAHYGWHENDPADPRYRKFLARLADPLVGRLPAGAEGLDYGSGPGPTLSLMLEERGFRVNTYDPFFAPDRKPLHQSYDFVTCTETVEHFFSPAREFETLDRLLRPGGWLAIMTEILEEGISVGGWRYARDPTHVSFYRPATMEWIAHRFGWLAEMPHPNVVLFRKPELAGAEFSGASPRSA